MQKVSYPKIKKHSPILFIALLGLFVGLSFVYLGPDLPISSDFWDVYKPAAESLSKGEGFGLYEGAPNIKAMPVFPIFVAIIYYFGGGIKEFAAFQSLFLAGIGIFAYLIAKMYLSKKIALFAAINIMLWPYFILYTKLIYTEVIFVFFLLLAVYCLSRFMKEETYKYALLAGIFLGIATLTRAIVFLLPLWIFFSYLIVRKEIIKEYFSWKKWGVLLVAFMIVLSPWLVRNYIHYNTLVVADGLSGMLRKSYIDYDYVNLDDKPIPASERTLKKHITSRIKNIYLFWNPGAGGKYTEGLEEKFPQASILIHMYWGVFFVILGLAFLSLKWAWRRKDIFLFWSIILYFWTVHIFLFPYPRYTLPIIPLVIILAWLIVQKTFTKQTSDISSL